jgi:hypothetical protein
MRAATVALVVQLREGSCELVATLSDDREIEVLEASLASGDDDPLGRVQAERQRQEREDGEFGDYVEDLLSHPFQKKEVREHGLQWLKSKLRIEAYQRKENEAASIIAQYALEVFMQQPDKMDFFLAGPNAQVRVQIFILPEGEAMARAA